MAKLIVADSKGNYLRDLTGRIKVGEVIGVQSEGPVTFVSGTTMRREQNPPFFVAGDNGTTPNPWTPVVGSTIRIQAIAGPTQELLDMTVVVDPAVTPLTRLVLPADQTGDGKVNQDLVGLHLINYEQSIVFNDGKDHTIDNCISDSPYTRDRVNAVFKGQTLYVEAMVKDSAGKLRPAPSDPVPATFTPVPTAVTVTRAAFLDAGRPTNHHQKGMFWHGGYVNKYGTIHYYRVIFANPCNCGVKIMRDAIFDECVFLNCAIGAQILYRPSLFRKCVVYRSNYYWSGQRDMGNLGFDLYAPVACDDMLWIGGPPAVSTENPLNLGLMKFNKSHNQYTDTPGASTATTRLSNCRAYNWPVSDNKNRPYFDGDAWNGTAQTLPGLTIQTGKAITYDEQAVIEDMRAYKISVEDAAVKIQADLRALVA